MLIRLNSLLSISQFVLVHWWTHTLTHTKEKKTTVFMLKFWIMLMFS